MNIDLPTGARAFAMASMSWDRVALSPSFRVEQFEPKVKRGDWYLTKEGKWWVKYPTEECRIVVETARDRLPKGRRFLFFEDAKSDKANALQASYLMSKMAVRFKKIFSELDKAGSMKRQELTRLGMDCTLTGIRCIYSGIQWHSITIGY